MRVLSLPPRRQLMILGIGGTRFAVPYGVPTAVATGELDRLNPEYRSAHRAKKIAPDQRPSVTCWSAS